MALAGEALEQRIPLPMAPEHMQLDSSGKVLAVSNFAADLVLCSSISPANVK